MVGERIVLEGANKVQEGGKAVVAVRINVRDVAEGTMNFHHV